MIKRRLEKKVLSPEGPEDFYARDSRDSEPKNTVVKKVDCKKIPTFENDDTRSTMSEPAKDRAIEITPKPQASSVRVPRIVAEINRVASRVRDRNKKEEEDIDDADVLENDAPAPSPKPADIQIIRENTHYRGKKRLNILLAFLLVLISVLLLAVCVFLARIDENIRSGGGTNVQSLASQPPPPPPPTVITPSSYVSMEHKAVFWDTVLDFKTSAENEGVSTTDMDACSTATTTTDYWYSLPSLDQKCLVELLLSTLEKENWTLTTSHAFGYEPKSIYSTTQSRYAYHFTRPVQTS